MKESRFIIFSFALLIIFFGVSNTYSAPFNFIVMADSRGSNNGVNDAVLSRIVDLVLLEYAEFLLFPGDLVTGDSMDSTLTSQLYHWRDVMEPIYASDMYGEKLYAGPGNHEIRHSGSEAVWQSVFSDLPFNGPTGEIYMTYSFDYQNSHFIMLNTDRAGLSHTINYDWLADDLASTSAEHIFVFGHEPAFPVGPHLRSSLDVYPVQRNAFWQLLSDYNVEIYFAGHEHLYNHIEVDGVHQVITGTCGAPIYSGSGGEFYHYALVSVDESDLFLDIIDDSGTMRDSIDLCRNDSVRIEPTALPYVTLQEAYDESSDSDTIQSRNLIIDENLDFDLPKTVTLEGGYECDYSTITGETTINGDVEISDGLLIIDTGTFVIDNIM